MVQLEPSKSRKINSVGENDWNIIGKIRAIPTRIFLTQMRPHRTKMTTAIGVVSRVKATVQNQLFIKSQSIPNLARVMMESLLRPRNNSKWRIELKIRMTAAKTCTNALHSSNFGPENNLDSATRNPTSLVFQFILLAKVGLKQRHPRLPMTLLKPRQTAQRRHE